MENISGGDGGGIACENASPVVTNSTITGNISFDNGGGIFCTNSAIAIQDCVICSNAAADHGGGVYWQGSSSAAIRDSTLEENSAVDGGGIGLKNSDATVSGCTIRNNTANEDGGGIRCKECCPLIVNCKITENQAWKDGGGIECTTNAAARILQCTVADNESAESGGGLYANYSCPTNYNCIFWGNSATNDGDQIGWSAAGSTVKVEWCDIESWTNGGTGNTNAEPLLVPGNYRLKADSPCIDAGVSNALTAGVPVDIENQGRWDDPGHTTVTSRWDMGCYEFVDGDADQMDDWWEILYLGGTNAAAGGDLDADGVTNQTEYLMGTHPGTNDSDGDGLTDYAETNTYKTNPRKPDTDADGMKDGYEVAYGLSATNKLDALGDEDTDGVLNGIEAVSGTCPTNSADPAATNMVLVQFQIGDASGTSSEIYTACVDLVPVLTSTNGQGVLSTNIMLVRGCAYTVMKRHRPGVAGIVDCDYTWMIAGKGVRVATNDPVDLPGDTWFSDPPGVLVHDPLEALGNYDQAGSSTPPYPCARVKVYIPTVAMKSLIFTSDHGVLTSYTNDFAGSNGVVFNPRGWTVTGTNNPISQTKGTKLMANVTLCVKPSGVPYDLTGDGGLLNYYTFSAEGLMSSGADQTWLLTADAVLPAQVDVLSHSIEWSIDAVGVTCVATSSGPHKVYVTWGTPTGTEPTLIRMDWTAALAQFAASSDDIANAVGPDAVGGARFGAKSIFGSPPTLTTAWQVMDGDDGDCGSLSTLMQYELDMLGATGAVVRFVYPRHATWTGLSQPSPPYAAYSETNSSGTRLLMWFAGGSGAGKNNYEGCCEFLSRWWMGGNGFATNSAYGVLTYCTSPNADGTNNSHQCWESNVTNAVDYPPGTP